MVKTKNWGEKHTKHKEPLESKKQRRKSMIQKKYLQK